MKRNLFCLLLILLIVTSCQKNNILNHEEIMKGNLSSISGEYINSEGDVIYLESNLQEKLIGEVKYMDGLYYLNIKSDDGYGVSLTIYPEGTDVLTWSKDDRRVVMKTDTSKIRIRYGQDLPILEDEIYNKK